MRCFAVIIVASMAVGMADAQEFVSPPPFDAQHPLVVGPPATTVQLPTFNFFTISTSVMVPDRGAAYLGGVGGGSAASGSNGIPGFGPRAGASGLNAGGMQVRAQIHDLREMDRLLLAERNRGASPEAAALAVWQARLERAKQSTAGRPAMSVAAARAAALR